jgi:uncharacterized membrane protein
MCINAGKVDRIIRVIIGLALIVYGLYITNYIIAGIGLIPLITGIVGFCPFYTIFKINTGCKK